MNNSHTPVILASRSPRRIELLKTVIKNFQVIPSEIDETCNANLSPEENVMFLSRKKATWVAKCHPHHLVIGADTLVFLKNEIIGKPTDVEDACRILRRLNGREHKVITGVAVVHSKTLSAASVSRVRIKPLTQNESLLMSILVNLWTKLGLMLFKDKDRFWLKVTRDPIRISLACQ